ncbi:MAG: hypothetical protein K2M72_02950, partial [Paramuribaculum sp.]|nr:hypothetical protein [Paramuribaculum sp.]
PGVRIPLSPPPKRSNLKAGCFFCFMPAFIVACYRGAEGFKNNTSYRLAYKVNFFYQIVMFRKSMINPAFHVHQQLIDTVTSQ